jgi:hypothetical protein
MIPNVKDFVVLIFKNSIRVEGFVNFWSEKKIILESRNKDCFIVINDLSEVLAYKIIKDIQKQDQNNKSEKAESIRQALYNDYDTQSYMKDKNIHRNEDGSLDIKSLAELRKMEAESERQIIINKLKNHRISGIQSVKYDTPRFFKK